MAFCHSNNLLLYMAQPSFVSQPVAQVIHTDIYQLGDRLVLEDVNFSIQKGEFVYLIGRTGSGKSSLLKTLYADLSLKKGSVQVAGYELNSIRRSDVPYLRRKLGIVFQDFQLFMDRNITQNLEFVLRATGWTDPMKMKTRIAEVLIRVGLSGSLQKMPHQLSGGEQQRVVIARALLNEPEILLADEPTGNLDPEVSEEIMRLFLQINKSGMAVLMATHDFDLIRKFPQRVLRCENSKVVEVTTPV
ncbi:cell division transport system ATP-binding protein [Siphonobacter aquaeclarae]|uniref:Cell division ATP-binding protein FtsE n=2 Tax=Siphonobacter aquaeclarae TaxID=563176 RepID=A0A1G9L7X1_9BACT|nr:cell division transport system ATP-binding protein [Siphonobacter aquaeclarae]